MVSYEDAEGSVTIKVEPLLTALFTAIDPLCDSTIFLAIDNPKPKPSITDRDLSAR